MMLLPINFLPQDREELFSLNIQQIDQEYTKLIELHTKLKETSYDSPELAKDFFASKSGRFIQKHLENIQKIQKEAMSTLHTISQIFQFLERDPNCSVTLQLFKKDPRNCQYLRFKNILNEEICHEIEHQWEKILQGCFETKYPHLSPAFSDEALVLQGLPTSGSLRVECSSSRSPGRNASSFASASPRFHLTSVPSSVITKLQSDASPSASLRIPHVASASSSFRNSRPSPLTIPVPRPLVYEIPATPFPPARSPEKPKRTNCCHFFTKCFRPKGS